MKKKFQILSQFKTPQPLMAAEKITFFLPYEDGRYLEKSSVEIIDAEKGIVELEITDFELQGLKTGLNQNCTAKIFMQDMDVLLAKFSKCLNITIKDDRKVWL